MSGVLGGDILGKSEQVDIEQVTLSERLRSLDLEIDPASVIAEAAAILREVRDFLLPNKGRQRYNWGHWGSILGDLLFLYTVGIHENGEEIRVTGMSIVDLLEAGEPEGMLRAADILNDIQDSLQFEDGRGWFSPAERKNKVSGFQRRLAATVCRSRLCLEPQISCDVEGCPHRSAARTSLQQASLWARWEGWQVSDDQDLCPSHCEILGVIPLSPLSEAFVEEPRYAFWQEADMAFRVGMPLEKFVALLQGALDEEAQRALASDILDQPWMANQPRDPITIPRGYAVTALEDLRSSLPTPPAAEGSDPA